MCWRSWVSWSSDIGLCSKFEQRRASECGWGLADRRLFLITLVGGQRRDRADRRRLSSSASEPSRRRGWWNRLGRSSWTSPRVLSLPAAVAVGVAAGRRTRKAQLIVCLAVGVMIGVPALGVLLGLVGLAAGVK